MLLIDKYKPIVGESKFHHDIIKIIETMAGDKSIPHLIFHGPEGSGKKTIVNLLLQMIHGPTVNYITNKTYEVSSSGSKSIEVIVKQSGDHIVIDPSGNNFDRYIIQDIVKEYARHTHINSFLDAKRYKTVVINNIDQLSYYAQTSLRRTMEKYSHNCRFIMWCSSMSKVIEPLRSRCVSFRIPAPTRLEIFELLLQVCEREKIELTLSDYSIILNQCGRNIKKALWYLEMHKHKIKPTSDYQNAINTIIDLIKVPNTEMQIRNIIYNLLVTHISGSKIIQDLLMGILKTKVNAHNIIAAAAYYDYNMNMGRRDIFHIEAFINQVRLEIQQ